MKRIQCQRCLVTHRVQTAAQHRTRQRCETPKCGLPFWAAQTGSNEPVTMGIDPENVELWIASGAKELEDEHE